MKLPVARRARLQAASFEEMTLALYMRCATWALEARDARRFDSARLWARRAREHLAEWLAVKGLAR